MEAQQREFLLRQQLQAIRKELGDEDDEDGADAYRERVAAADLPEAVRTAVDREIGRLERTGAQNPEQGWIRTWLDTILDLPWGVRSTEDLDVTNARGVLDADHTGLNDVKDRIVEYLAVRKLRAERGFDRTDPEAPHPTRRGDGLILALVGPPGVGKTSLGESVARATGRAFVRVALGGVRDEAEIRGHRRTYVGALPGRIARALKEAGTMNPVILLDEVDKLGADWRGDPSSALLEVLDPAQNHTFRDHYLDVDLDLSGVLFIATANVADTIPGPLLDRMEVVRLDGYTEEEKVAIAVTTSWPVNSSATGSSPPTSRSTRPRCGPSSPGTPVKRASGRWNARSGGCCARSRPGSPPGPVRRTPTPARSSSTTRSCARTWADPASRPRRSPTARSGPAWPPASRSPVPAATCCSSRRPRSTASPDCS